MLNSSRPQFYRITSAFKRFELDVGEPLQTQGGRRHRLYGEMSGNPDGPVVLCLHGGPGAGSNPATRQFFDPDHYCIVQFDQRGAGRSQPWACMEQNSTTHLVEDIEAIAQHLGIERFILFGGSWGSTLALAYAAQYPNRVSAMVLRGVFLGRPRDIEWFLWGVQGVQPEAHHAFVAPLLPHEQTSASAILASYVSRLMSDDAGVAQAAALAWARYEDAAATLADNSARTRAMAGFERLRRPNGDQGSSKGFVSSKDGGSSGGGYTLAIARAEAYYLSNGLFLPPDGLVAQAHRWHHVPGTIVHGRYDMVCQVQGAIELANAWPRAALKIIDNAGHSTFEDGIAGALLSAMEALKNRNDSG